MRPRESINFSISPRWPPCGLLNVRQVADDVAETALAAFGGADGLLEPKPRLLVLVLLVLLLPFTCGESPFVFFCFGCSGRCTLSPLTAFVTGADLTLLGMCSLLGFILLLV